MIHTPTQLLNVYLNVANGRRKIGRLAFRERRILFEYEVDFIASSVEISPFKLPLKAGVRVCEDMIFEGLFGVFNDSLPDGWGRLLLDRAVEKQGVNRRQLNPLDRLAFVGRHGMGALSYEPERKQSPGIDGRLALDRLAAESAIVLAGESDDVFEDLLRLNGSSSGARPKIVAQVNGERSRIVHGQSELREGYAHWMIKFPSAQDPRDIGAIEYAYSVMAADAGVTMAPTHLFRARKQRYFGAQRFDRRGDARVHMHSLAGLIHADHRAPSLDYDTILRVALVLTKNVVEAEKVYALACFNVLAHNRDDHGKNFSFLLNDANEWEFAPAYDLTFSFGPGGEQSTMVNGEGKNPGLAHLRELARKHSLKNAPAILQKVRDAISRWSLHAQESGVTARSLKQIAAKIAG